VIPEFFYEPFWNVMIVVGLLIILPRRILSVGSTNLVNFEVLKFLWSFKYLLQSGCNLGEKNLRVTERFNKQLFSLFISCILNVTLLEKMWYC